MFEDAGIEDADGFAIAWSRSIAINLRCATDLCRQAVLYFRTIGGGRIVNVALKNDDMPFGVLDRHMAPTIGGLKQLRPRGVDQSSG